MQRAPRFWVETLGCPKNAVDSDKVTASLLADDGLDAAMDPDDADLVVVNTCAFVDAARQESIEAVLALGERRKAGAKLVVTGCMAERYADELAAALPEVDAVVGFAGEGAIGQLFGGVPAFGGVAVDAPRRLPSGVRDLLELPRAAPSVPWAYVKVAEGCDRACTFCAIPSFRGKQRSRTPESLVAESRSLVEAGVSELVLVAQDLAWYGRDAGETGALAPLLRRLDAELGPAGLRRIRLLYLYPSEVRDPLVATMLELETVVPYFDLSLQHADRTLLARMKRWGSGERFTAMIDDIRAREPDAVFRSSFIVGFPGETEAEHDTLLAFLRDARLDWAGFFSFSPEDGTPAATMDDRAPDHVVREWLRECDEVQVPITEAARDSLVRAGAEVEVLVDGTDDETGAAVGRTHREAPEIDGVVYLEGAVARPGVFVRAKVTEAFGVDLHAEPIEVVSVKTDPEKTAADTSGKPSAPVTKGSPELTPSERARKFSESAIKTPANVVTFLRLLFSVPVLVWILDEGDATWGTLTGWLVLWLTDGLDGLLARRDGTTRSGAFLDPLADKILVLGGFIALGVRGDFAWVPIAIVVVREVVALLYRTLEGRRGVSLPARRLGKWKANAQFLAVTVVLFPPTEDVTWLHDAVLWIAVALSIVSFVDLVMAANRASRGSERNAV